MCGKELLLLGGKQLSSVICTCHCYTGRRHGEGAGEMAAAGEIWGEDLGAERWILPPLFSLVKFSLKCFSSRLVTWFLAKVAKDQV